MDRRDTILLLPSRIRVLMFTCGCALLLSLNIFFISQNYFAVFSYCSAAFFGYHTLAWLSMLMPHTRLELTEDSFALHTAMHRFNYRWQDVSGFDIYGFGIARIVCFNISNGDLRRAPFHVAHHAACGFDGFLPNIFSLPPPVLADLLNEWLAWSQGNGKSGHDKC